MSNAMTAPAAANATNPWPDVLASRDRFEPLQELDPRSVEKILQLEACWGAAVTAWDTGHPDGWGNNVPFSVLDERVWNARLDLARACALAAAGRLKGGEDRLLTFAARYRMWLATIVGCFGELSDELKQQDPEFIYRAGNLNSPDAVALETEYVAAFGRKPEGTGFQW